MQNQKLSKLQFYSLGIVAANKKLTEDLIEVTPIEEFPMLDGEITDNIEQYEAKFQNANEEPFKVDVKTTASIKAKWLPINNSNRRTSPDVRRGEHVVLYRFADTDEYWWNTLKNDNRIRRLETVIYSFNNLSVENKEDDADSSYWLEVSTHRKIMHVHTSKNDGEPFAYDIQINAKDGKIVITDDVGNYFVLNSKENHIRLENATGSFAELNKGNVNINAPENINMLASKLTMQISGEINMTAGTINRFANSLNDMGNTSSMGGNTTIKGNLSVNGNISNGGGVSSGGAHVAPVFTQGTGSAANPTVTVPPPEKVTL